MQSIKCPNCSELQDKLNKAEDELGRQYEVIGENELLLETLRKQLREKDEQIKQLGTASIVQSNPSDNSQGLSEKKNNEIESLQKNNKNYLQCLAKLLNKDPQSIENMQYNDLLQLTEDIVAKLAKGKEGEGSRTAEKSSISRTETEAEHNRDILVKEELRTKIAEYEKLLSEHRQLVEINQQIVKEKAELFKENNALEQKLFELNQNFEKLNSELSESKIDLDTERQRFAQLQKEVDTLKSENGKLISIKEAVSEKDQRETSEFSSPDYDKRDAVIVRLNERILQLEEKLASHKQSGSEKAHVNHHGDSQSDQMGHQSAKVFGSLLRSQLDPKELPVVQDYFKRIETENENLRLQIRKVEQERKLITETLTEVVGASKIYRSESFPAVFKKLSVMVQDAEKLHRDSAQVIERESVRTFILLLLNTVKFVESSIKNIWMREDQSTTQLASLLKVAQANEFSFREHKPQPDMSPNERFNTEKTSYEGLNTESSQKQQRKKLEITLPEYDHVEPVKFHLASPQESKSLKTGTPVEANRSRPISSCKASDNYQEMGGRGFPSDEKTSDEKTSIRSTPNAQGVKAHIRQQSGQLHSRPTELAGYFSTPKSHQSQQEISTQTSSKAHAFPPRSGDSTGKSAVKRFDLDKAVSPNRGTAYGLEEIKKKTDAALYENDQHRPRQLSEKAHSHSKILVIIMILIYLYYIAKKIQNIAGGLREEESDDFESDPTHILTSLKELKAFVKNINENNDSILNNLSKTYDRSMHKPETKASQQPQEPLYRKASTPTHEISKNKNLYESNPIAIFQV